MRLKVFFQETRPHFLLLSAVLAFLGTSIAWYDGALRWDYAVLAFVGLLLAHISANVLNDYFDYRSGIDLATNRTPFSGGSGVLTAGILQPKHVLWFGLITFLLTVPIGLFFVIVQGWILLPLLLVGALCLMLYTPLITRVGWPEWAPGVGLGALPVLGAYFVQTGQYTLPALVASIPSGILVHNLLFLNEFPDVEADRKGGRKTLPIMLGQRKASVLYSILILFTYVWIIGGVLAATMPAFSLIALGTVPLAVKAIRGALRYDDESKLLPALGTNVLVVLLTQFLLGIGYILAKMF